MDWWLEMTVQHLFLTMINVCILGVDCFVSDDDGSFRLLIRLYSECIKQRYLSENY